MTEHELLDYEAELTREDAAALVAGVADDLHRGGAVGIDVEGRRVTVDGPPDGPIRVEVEVEHKRHEGDPDTVEVEVELEWPIGDESTVVAALAADEMPDGEGGERAGEEVTGETGDEETGDEETDDADTDRPEEPVESRGSLGEFQVYRDRADEWRWRLVHRNGNIIATSGEGYATRANAEKGMRSVMRNARDAGVVVEGQEGSTGPDEETPER